jgi:hypothetical protein
MFAWAASPPCDGSGSRGGVGGYEWGVWGVCGCASCGSARGGERRAAPASQSAGGGGGGCLLELTSDMCSVYISDTEDRYTREMERTLPARRFRVSFDSGAGGEVGVE